MADKKLPCMDHTRIVWRVAQPPWAMLHSSTEFDDQVGSTKKKKEEGSKFYKKVT